MYYLGSNSCHVIHVCHIFLMKYISALFLMQLFVIANSTLKQLIIPEYHMGVYLKGGSNANGRTSIFVVSHDYVKAVVSERKHFSSKCHNSDIDIDKSSLQNPSQDKLSPATPSQVSLCIRYSRYCIRFH